MAPSLSLSGGLRTLAAIAALLIGATGVAIGQTAASRLTFPDSIKSVPTDAASAPASTRHAHLLRRDLHADESSAPMTFEIALRMNHFSDLQARLASGEQIARDEMSRTYDPAQSDYDRVVAWVKSQNLRIVRTDDDRLAVFATGTVSQVAAALQVNFGRVAADDAEYTSALTAPSLPSDVGASVVGIHGLQPHLRLRHRLAPIKRQTDATTNSTGYTPSQIAQTYGANNLNANGSGQTIAIFSGAFAANSDLTAFWTQNNISDLTSRIVPVTVGTGPAGGETDTSEEATLDEEWASGLAPAATIRVYGANDNDTNFFDEILQAVYADLPANPTMHVLSVSYGADEDETDHDYIVILSQYCANLASAGVSIFDATGDEGAVQDGVVQVCIPASDPNVTGVGGTTLTLGANNSVTSEVGWSGSNGGASMFISRPSWQTGTGVPSGTMRLVPDVAAAADPNEGAAFYFQGKAGTIGGTSWATPTWAAFCALINQSRAANGQGPVGNLNTRIYSLIGTSSFRDITSGSNGVYSCNVGYDEVTGCGVPNVAALAAASLTPPGAPAVYSQLGSRTTVVGQPATFFIVASGATPFTYQWQRQPAGASGFGNLSDNGTYSGSATSMLVVNGTTTAMSGDQFQCVVTNAQGSAVSSPADTLTVNTTGVTTLAGWAQSWGIADGTGMNARFESPGGIRGDGNGNFYVADGGASTIRLVTAAGVVTTVVGSPNAPGSTDGPVATARINSPGGVAVDSAGNMYIADSLNYTIRKVSGGVVSTLAGLAGSSAYLDGTGTAARFKDPEDCAVDSSGNVYVADGAGNRIRKITPAGVVSTLAGSGSAGSANGTGTAAQFNDPLGLAVDASGNVFVADSGNNMIRKVTAAGVVTTVAGSTRSGSTDGASGSARFNEPSGVSLDSAGDVYVADGGNATIRMVSAAGVVSTLAGAAGQEENIDGLPTVARFSEPAQAFYDASSGAILVADLMTGTIRRVVVALPATAPQITTQPSSQSVTSGQMVSLAVVANGTAPLVYRWELLEAGSSTWISLIDGAGISGSATATLTINPSAVTYSGAQFRCVVTNASGTATSSPATLTVAGPPAVLATTETESAANSGSLTLSVTAAGVGVSYQWLFNGTAISGATGTSYTISNFTSAAAGTYSIAVSNAYGTTSVQVAAIPVASARLVNLSAMATSSSGASGALAAGFSIGGNGVKNVLLRGDGPTLATFGVANVLPDPVLTLYNSSSSPLAQNEGWGGGSALSAAFAASGAFALPDTSEDSALLESLNVGVYSMEVAGASNDSGTALAEIYDLDPEVSTSRLINISARAPINGAGSTLTAGFVVGGAGSEEVLVRGIGPTLAQYGVSNYLSDPVLSVYNTSTSQVVKSNAGWGGSSTLSAIFTQVGAFALPTSSADAALTVTLSPGTYSAQVTSASGGSGVVLVEVYEVP